MMSRSRLLSYFVSVSHVLWKIQSFIWISIILNLVLAVLVTWSFTDPSALKNTPIAILAKNPYPFLLLLIFLVFLFLITYLGHLLPPQIGRTDRELHNIYLENMIQKTQLLRLKGIPTGLFAESVQLEQVFIPLQFYPNRSLAAYPLPEAELEEMRNAEKEGHLDLQHQGVLLDAESNWQRPFVPNDILSISQLWERLTKEEPYAVIQGFLGMGKSTLLDRLTLYMSHNCLEIVDTLSLHTPALIPIYVSLKQYAEAQTDSKRDKKTTLTLTEYMELIVIRLDMRIEVRDIANLVHLLQKYLEKGQCLVMFDGLDEVLDLSLRVRVQEEIKSFIDRWRTKHIAKKASFNRFLITSRVAGYDQQAFSCPHLTVAELTPDQITMFLPEWCRAKVIRERQSTSSMDATAVIEKEVQNMARDIQDTALSNFIEHFFIAGKPACRAGLCRSKKYRLKFDKAIRLKDIQEWVIL